MKLTPTEPDLATIYRRIVNNDLDLQPDFQRQEVWPDAKRRRLIDTILRGWHVPPIHVVDTGDGTHEVLDGQQRLVAIRDFMAGRLHVDGYVDPPNDNILQLDNLRYVDLPASVRRRFDSYPVRLIIISEYEPEEPGELFFRLNQQTTLTAPEQRNAFFGRARDQVRVLVRHCRKSGLDKSRIGFTNSRMAYDDIVARFCEALEAGTLHKKITAAAVTDRYRSRSGYSRQTLTRAKAALVTLIELLEEHEASVALNKGTSHTWLCFIATFQRETPAAWHVKKLRAFLNSFEPTRTSLRISERSSSELLRWTAVDSELAATALRIYNDRASARVADVTSVLVRDYVTWLLFSGYCRRAGLKSALTSNRLRAIDRHSQRLRFDAKLVDSSETLGKALEESEWGVEI